MLNVRNYDRPSLAGQMRSLSVVDAHESSEGEETTPLLRIALTEVHIQAML